MNEDNKRIYRGKGKKPAMLCTSLRIPIDVLDYFAKHHPYTKQAKIREILINYVKQQGALNEETNSTNQ